MKLQMRDDTATVVLIEQRGAQYALILNYDSETKILRCMEEIYERRSRWIEYRDSFSFSRDCSVVVTHARGRESVDGIIRIIILVVDERFFGSALVLSTRLRKIREHARLRSTRKIRGVMNGWMKCGSGRETANTYLDRVSPKASRETEREGRNLSNENNSRNHPLSPRFSFLICSTFSLQIRWHHKFSIS